MIDMMWEFQPVRPDGKRNASALKVVEEALRRVAVDPDRRITVVPCGNGLVRVTEYIG